MRAPFRPLVSAFMRMAPHRAVAAAPARSMADLTADREPTAAEIEEYSDPKIMALNHITEIKEMLASSWSEKVAIPDDVAAKAAKDMKTEMDKFDEGHLNVDIPKEVSLEDIFGKM